MAVVSNPRVTDRDEIARPGKEGAPDKAEWSILLGMDINRFTEKLQEAIRSAQSKAVRYGHQQIDVEHLLAALLEQEGGLAPSILAKAGVAVPSLQRRIESELDRMPKVSGPTGGPTRSTSRHA